MKILHEKPPVWDNACAAFQVNPKYTVFTYGDTIYNPSGRPIPDDVIAHEMIHVEQQKDGADLWWGKYLRDPEFRVQQEAWAYAAQFAFLCEQKKDRNTRVRVLMDLANLLSGPLYAKSVSHKDAVRLIQQYSGIKIIK